MKIIIDTREQKPYSFKDVEGVESVTRAALPTGDYSLEGYENHAAIERKSLDDFISTVIHDKQRFLQELDRAKQLVFFAVVVEASVADIALQRYTSKASPAAVFAHVASLMLDWRIPVIFCNDRAGAQVMTAVLLKYCKKKILLNSDIFY